MNKRFVFLMSILVSLTIFSACSPSAGNNNVSDNQNPGEVVPDTDSSHADPDSSDDNVLTVNEISLVYEGARTARSYVIMNITDLKKAGVISEGTSITSMVYTFKNEHVCSISPTATLTSLSIRKGAVVTSSRQGSGTSSFIGVLTINGKAYSVSYTNSSGVPSLIINGVKVY